MIETMCPISLKKVNEGVVRLNATLTVASMILFFLTPFKWLIWVLAADFFIRGFLDPAYSYYSAVSKMIVRVVKAPPEMVDAGPKIFAAKIGFIFCGLAGICQVANLPVLSAIIGACLILFATLEAVWGFCLACKVYPLICKIKSPGS